MVDLSFYSGKKVLITGHTGFKGAWLCRTLLNAGAVVIGYALEPSSSPNLFSLSKVACNPKMTSVFGDIRDFAKLKSVFDKYQPSIVIHMAAQPLVRPSYKDPKYTYDVNVMGTVNVLECVRLTKSVKSFLNVTTDKVYFNDDDPDHPFKEEEALDGYDPYSNSKSCSELVTHSYSRSFFRDARCSISTARAGNVIGGGDFSEDRIIPDCVRAIQNQTVLVIRHPESTRPYQHVLEPLFVYLEICEKQFNNKLFEGSYNVGPDDSDCVNTAKLVRLFSELWSGGLCWECKCDGGPHEASFLKLNNGKIKKTFGWQPRWHIRTAIKMVCDWTRCYFDNSDDVPLEMDREIASFLKTDHD